MGCRLDRMHRQRATSKAQAGRRESCVLRAQKRARARRAPGCGLGHEGMEAEPEGVAGTVTAPASVSLFLLGHSEPTVARLPGSWTRPVTKCWPMKREQQ